MPKDDHDQLVEAITKKYPVYGKWEFAYEYPGVFCYYLKGTDITVFFTPDHTTRDVVDIQVDQDGRDIDAGEVPFTKRTVDNLFHAVQPWLDKHGR